MQSLAGKTAVITGAGRGIGRAIAETFARQGANIVCAARSPRELAETREALEEFGVGVLTVACDLAQHDEILRLVRETREAFGAPDVLVNNAGYARFSAFAETSLDTWRQTLDVNLTAPYVLTQAFLPGMILRGSGRIINISSVAGLKGIAHQSAYCASKHALNGLTKVLALELNPLGIGVHAICPGGVKTRLADEAMPERAKDDWMSPQDIADAALYVATLSNHTAVDILTLRRSASTPL